MHPNPITTEENKAQLKALAADRLKILDEVKMHYQTKEKAAQLLGKANRALSESTVKLAAYVGPSQRKVAIRMDNDLVCVITNVPGNERASVDFVKLLT